MSPFDLANAPIKAIFFVSLDKGNTFLSFFNKTMERSAMWRVAFRMGGEFSTCRALSGLQTVPVRISFLKCGVQRRLIYFLSLCLL